MSKSRTRRPYGTYGFSARKRRRSGRNRGKFAKFSKLKIGSGILALAAALGIYTLTDFEALIATPSIVGVASVIDGDTLDVNGQRIRLHGIDAPESRQACQDAKGWDYRCGQQATRALIGKIGGQAVSCDRWDTDRYGRTVAVCWAGGENLNRWLVSEGLAVAYTRYSMKYIPAELAARIAGRGIWAGDFMAPERWRRRNRS
jgi:endonuclease YncB( thermonuclease family)